MSSKTGNKVSSGFTVLSLVQATASGLLKKNLLGIS